MTNATQSRTIESALAASGLDSKAFITGGPGWDAARQAWNLAVDQRPAAVVFPETIDDVVAALRVADDSGASIVVQGTGHGAASYGELTDTILIRTGRMRKIEIRDGVCSAEAGTLWGEVALDAADSGFAPLAGSSPDVGVVGYSLGGGIGWLSRRYGLASNAIRSVDIVTADGTFQRIDAEHRPELFWAVRGGGAGFGIVTGIEFDLMPVSHVYGGTLAWDAMHAPALFGAWADWTAGLDDSITSIMRFLNLPPIPDVPEPFRGRRVVTLGAVGVGGDDSAQAAIDRMRSVATPILDAFDSMPASALVRLHGDPEGPTPGASHHALLSTLDDSVISELVDRAGAESGSPLVSVEVRHLGGELARPRPDGGALSHIEAPYAVMGVGMAADPEQSRVTHDALSGLVGALSPWHSGSYLNFAERASDSPFDSATAGALADIKSAVDPTGRFKLRGNQHFGPSPSAGA